MKLSLPFFTILGAAALTPCGQAATTYSTGFNIPQYNTGSQLAGQDGWAINDAIPWLSFFVNFDGSNAGGLGGYLDAPASTHVDLTHPYGGTLSGTQFSVEFALIASTTQHPGADSFGYSFRDTSNNTLLRVAFEPNPGSTESLEIVYYDASNTRTSTAFDLFYSSSYDLDISFGASGTNGLFSLAIGNTLGTNQLVTNKVLAGAGSAVLASVGVDFDVTGATGASSGDNFIVFDDFSVTGPSLVPAPTLNISLNASKQPVISFQGVPGTSYELQRSTTMLANSWLPQNTITAPAGGAVQFIDLTPPAGHAFYRVAIRP